MVLSELTPESKKKKKASKKYKDHRLNALVGKPEEIVRVKGRKAKDVLVKPAKKELVMTGHSPTRALP
jgi:hypothetical protein